MEGGGKAVNHDKADAILRVSTLLLAEKAIVSTKAFANAICQKMAKDYVQ
jgi:hypothetical protein